MTPSSETAVYLFATKGKCSGLFGRLFIQKLCTFPCYELHYYPSGSDVISRQYPDL